MRCWNVGIIGGGPGGLLTAYLLQSRANASFTTTLFEASDRFGGKILTPKFDSLPASYEAGAAEMYDYSPVGEDPLRELIAELGLSTNPIGGSAVVMNQRVLANLDDVREYLGDDIHDDVVRFDRVAKDWITPHEFYHSDDGIEGAKPAETARFDAVLGKLLPHRARRYVECMIHSDLATEPGRTSVTYGLQNYLMNDARYMQLYSIEGGNEQLPEALERRIQATKLLNHVVTDIERREGQFVVTYKHQGASCEKTFDMLVVALPHNALAKICFHGPRLAAAMQAHHEHYNHPTHYLRMSLLFDRPFWRGHLQDAFCMLDSFGGCCLYDESAREPGADHGALGWLLGGEVAKEMSALDDAALIIAALDSLPVAWGQARRWFREGRVHRWIDAINAIPGGLSPRSLDQRHQPEPVEHANLFVVGDYLFDATLNGVLDSATYVADWLVANMSHSTN